MSIEELLIEIGLSDKEAQMYITLLRSGNQPTSYLAKRSGFNRGTAYVILHQLVEKGLATKSTQKKIQYFAPMNPQNLVDYLDRKKQQAETGKQKVESMMRELTAITNPHTSKPKIEFFDGVEGARSVLNTTLQAKDGRLRAFLSISDIIEFVGGDFFDHYDQARLKHKKSLQVIRTHEKDKLAEAMDPRARKHTTNSREQREVHYASSDLAFPMTMFIFDDKLAVISSKEESFSVVLQSQELANMQGKLFDLLWNSMDRNKIKVGILHSLSGTMAISERSLVDAELMAIDEINESGGLLGKQVEPIVVDGKSDDQTFQKQAEELIEKENVCSIFGCWTSASRKEVLPVVEKHNHLLWYPVQYEGLEQSSNIVYLGAGPNQQVIPAINWIIQNLGPNIFCVGSDYVYPRSINAIARYCIEDNGGQLVGEEYQPLGSINFEKIVNKIKKEQPSVILNTINGDSNIAFFNQLRDAGITSQEIPTMSLSIAEDEISRMQPELVSGDFATWNYFQCLDTKTNKDFIDRFRKRYGQHCATDDAIETAYNAVHIFAKAVKVANSTDIESIQNATKGLRVDTPEGDVIVDQDHLNVYRATRIGQIQDDGQFKVVWSADNPIKPEPYPKYKSKYEWHAFLDDLYLGWGKKWAKQ